MTHVHRSNNIKTRLLKITVTYDIILEIFFISWKSGPFGNLQAFLLQKHKKEKQKLP